MDANHLSTLLWRERELLEMLLFKLEEEQLLLAAGKSNWLPFATREVEQVLERIRTAGFERTIEGQAVAIEWGLDEDAPLRVLVENAPDEVWRDVLQLHLEALIGLTSRIADVRDANLGYLRAATRATQETLAIVTDSRASGYDDRGERQTAQAGARLFDRKA